MNKETWLLPIDGQYFGAAEKSFLVVNSPKGKIVHLGKKYLQDSVIWGEKQRAMAEEGAGPNIFFVSFFLVPQKKGQSPQIPLKMKKMYLERKYSSER